MKRRTFLHSTAGGPLAVATQTGSPPARGSAAAPNILFILFDKCRTDAIGAYGLKAAHTPNIDRLAASGVRFQNCYTPQAVCGPARASIITGLYPHAHGLQKNVYESPRRGHDLYEDPVPHPFHDPRFHLWDNFPFLLGNGGYETGHIGKWHMGIANPGFFNTWKSFNSGLPPWVGEPHKSGYRADVQTSEGVEFIERNASRPFFLYMSYYPPHEPCDPPKEYLEFYQGSNDASTRYYGAVANLDWNVGRLVAALEKHRLLERTFIVLTTEHGRAWGPRPGTAAGHGYDIAYDEAARIPLILRYPPLLPKGLVWRSGVSLVDLMPTVLEIASVTPPRRLHGRSLLGVIREGRDQWDRALVIENFSQSPIEGSHCVERAIRTERWKLILRKFETRPQLRVDELYDLPADPEETRNVYASAEHKATVKDLAAMLRKWGEETGDPLAVELGRRSEAD